MDEVTNNKVKKLSRAEAVLKHCCTGKDNTTADVVRILGLCGGFAMIGYTGYVVIMTKVFDIVAFGGGFSALLGGIGVAVKVKESAEPSAE